MDFKGLCDRRRCLICGDGMISVCAGSGCSTSNDKPVVMEWFALRYILEIGSDWMIGCASASKVLEQKNPISHEEPPKGLGLCETCSKEVKRALDYYRELVRTLDKFRKVQKKLVDQIKWRRQRKREDGQDLEFWKFVRSNNYDFSGPFLINPDYEDAPEVKTEAPSERSRVQDDVSSEPDPLSFLDMAIKSENEDDEQSEMNSPVGSFIISEDAEDDDENEDGVRLPPPPPPYFVPSKETTPRSGRKRKLVTTTYQYLEDEAIILEESSHSSDSKSDTPAVKPHVCPICSKRFKTGRSLQKHKRLMHDSDKTKKSKAELPVPLESCCDLCGEVISNDDLLTHLRGHVGDEYLNRCPNTSCPVVFSNSFAVRFHLKGSKMCKKSLSPEFLEILKSRGQSAWYPCKQCATFCQDLTSLQAHLIRNHELIDKHLQCPIVGCRETFAVKQSVEVHLFKDHTKEPPRTRNLDAQKCGTCLKSVAIDKMESHLTAEHGAPEVIKCTQFPFLFPSREHQFHHLFTAHRHCGIPFVCDICDSSSVTFSDHLELRQHYFEAHRIGQKYVCDQCEKVCWTKQLLEHHLRYTHSGNQFTCSFCEDLAPGTTPPFKTSDSLQSHKIKVHGAEPYRCPHCPEIFAVRISLMNHIKMEHKRKVKPVYRCTISGCSCGGKVFNQKHLLKRHQDFVTGAKKYVCEPCDKHFTSLQGLQKHQDGVHLDIKRVICDTCGEGFRDQRMLKSHALIHSGERPFVCAQCGQRFRQNSVLGRHLKSHTEKGDSFKPTGPMKQIRRRVTPKRKKKFNGQLNKLYYSINYFIQRFF